VVVVVLVMCGGSVCDMLGSISDVLVVVVAVWWR
jgi:hypothetical protein